MDKDNHLEENTSRLIKTSLGGESKLDPDTQKTLLSVLQKELHPQNLDFPIWALGLTTGMVVVSILWVVSQTGLSAETLWQNPLWVMLAIPAFANLLLAPAASIVIVFSRRKNG